MGPLATVSVTLSFFFIVPTCFSLLQINLGIMKENKGYKKGNNQYFKYFHYDYFLVCTLSPAHLLTNKQWAFKEPVAKLIFVVNFGSLKPCTSCQIQRAFRAHCQICCCGKQRAFEARCQDLGSLRSRRLIWPKAQSCL